MMDWKCKLNEFLDKDTVIMGIGSDIKSDDRIGVYVTEELEKNENLNVITAGQTPEHWIGFIARKNYRKILICDAVTFEGETGEIRVFSLDEIARRFGLTHSSSLHLFANYLSTEGSVEEILILAVQPESVDVGEKLSSPVKKSADRIIDFLNNYNN